MMTTYRDIRLMTSDSVKWLWVLVVANWIPSTGVLQLVTSSRFMTRVDD